MPTNSLLTSLALLMLFVYVGKKLLSTKDLLLVAGAAGGIGFMLAGVFYRWALIIGLILLVAETFILVVAFRPTEGGLLVGIFNIYRKREVQTALVMGIALLVFAVFAFEQSRRNVTAVSGYIEIYEPHTSVEWIPRVNNDAVGSWILTTTDSASSVLEYYRQYGARDDWQIESYAPPTFVVLQKDGLKVSFIAKDSGDKDTVVLITLNTTDK